MRHRCIGFDWTIDTDRPIPGTLSAADNQDADTVRITWRAAAAPPREERPVWCRSDAGLWFDPPGVGRYLCTAAAIEVTPIEGTPCEMIDALLVATALPAIMWLGGDVVLHAFAVIPRGSERTIAIAGPSGCGKSRLAAAFVADGARLVADDSIAVRWQNRHAICAGLAGGYHLGAPGEEERPFHHLPERQTARSAPLGTVVLLSDDAHARERLSGVQAVAALLANRHRASVPRICGTEARVLDDAVRLARAVQVYRWPRQDADALLDDAVREAIMRDESGG